MKQSYIEELKNKISTLTITPNYFFVIESENGYYCQMIKVSATEYRIEAISHYHFNAVSKELIQAFNKRNYTLNISENYKKNVSINSDDEINDILNEIVYVFEEIYCLDKNVKYTITGDINQEVETKPSEVVVKVGNGNHPKRNIIVGIFGIVVIYFIFNFLFGTDKCDYKGCKRDSANWIIGGSDFGNFSGSAIHVYPNDRGEDGKRFCSKEHALMWQSEH